MNIIKRTWGCIMIIALMTAFKEIVINYSLILEWIGLIALILITIGIIGDIQYNKKAHPFMRWLCSKSVLAQYLVIVYVFTTYIGIDI